MQYSLSKTFSVIYTKFFFQRAPKISFQEKYHRKIYTWQSWLYKKYFSWQLFYLQNLQSVETGLTLTPVPNKNSHEGKVSSDMFAVASTEIKMVITKKKFVSGACKWMSNLLQIIKWFVMLSLVYLNMNFLWYLAMNFICCCEKCVYIP